MLAKMTITALHNFNSNKLWSKLSLPSGIDKDCFINEVLRQAAEFPLLYPDLEFMEMMIGQFSVKWYHNFERWEAAYRSEYKALYNVDVTTTTTDNAKDDDSDLKNFNLDRTGQNSANNSGTDERKKAAFDTSSYSPVEYVSNSGNTSLSTSESETHSESNSHSWEHSQTIEEVKRGNQGITMSQELLLAEYNAWLFNLYEHMAEIFVSEFCICIYQ